MNKHLNIEITGRVQGIGFRFSSYEKFAELGLLGKAENSGHDAILLDVEGPEEKLNLLVQWCHQGPTGAKVSNVKVTEAAGPFIPLKNG